MSKKELAKLAFEIVGIAGTAGSAYLSQKEQKHLQKAAGPVSIGGASSSAAAILTDQFVEATAYVQANGKSATLVGLNTHLNGKNLSISGGATKAAIKVGLNLPDLGDSNDLKVSTAQCVADVAELSFDVGLATAQAATGVGVLAASVTGVGMVAQLYATGVSCGNAAVQGIHAVGRMSKEAADQLAFIRNRIVERVSKYIEDASKDLTADYSPSKVDYSRLPKPALDELQLGLLSSLKLGELLPPVQFLKFLSVTKITQKDSVSLGKAVVLMYLMENSKDATMGPKDQSDAKRIGAEFVGLNLASAYDKFFDYGNFRTAISRK